MLMIKYEQKSMLKILLSILDFVDDFPKDTLTFGAQRTKLWNSRKISQIFSNWNANSPNVYEKNAKIRKIAKFVKLGEYTSIKWKKHERKWTKTHGIAWYFSLPENGDFVGLSWWWWSHTWYQSTFILEKFNHLW